MCPFLLRQYAYAKYIACLAAFLFLPSFLFAQQGYEAEKRILQDAQLAENVEIRQLVEQTLLDRSFEQASTPSAFYRQKSSPISVSLDMQKAGTDYYLRFINNVPTTERPAYTLRSYTRGSYFFQKNLASGDFVQVKIFIQDNPDSYILVEPEDEHRSRMSIFVYGSRFYHNVPVPMGMRAIAISPLVHLMSVTKYLIDWPALFQPAAYPEWQTIRWMIEQIRPQLILVRENEDGAQNEHGQFVYIETLQPQPTTQPFGFNCSGFVKWIVDGLFKPTNPQGLLIPIEPLKKEGLRQADNRWNDQYDMRDPYFGLDWIRNLAYAVRKARWPLQTVDLYAEDARNTSFTPFFNDIGYPLEKLEPVLYELAIKYPGDFFLGSISTEFGSAPVLRQHRHVATFFPYFDEYGNFRISIFDVGFERSPQNLIKAFPTGFVYFVRVEASKQFSLPVLRAENITEFAENSTQQENTPLVQVTSSRVP